MTTSLRRRRRRRARIAGAAIVIAAAGAVGGWYYLRARGSEPAPERVAAGGDADRPRVDIDVRGPLSAQREPLTGPPTPRAADFELVSDEQVAGPIAPTSGPASASVASRPAGPTSSPTTPLTELPVAAPREPVTSHPSGTGRHGLAAIEEGRRLYAAGKLLDARERLNNLLKGGLSETDGAEVRALLTRIADETIFSRNVPAGDPLADTYVVQAGDRLIHVASRYNVPYEAVMAINAIPAPTKIREGQRLKIPRGPFHAKIYKSKFRMDVYLGDLYVRSYRVGLGVQNGTPEGVWRVKNRLTNPTYYPPASAADKRIIAPDDPNNPLGEHWIGLEGLEGNAVGHEGYGIHGTIEPDSVGRAVSLGCIRMHNEDVAFLYKLLMPGRSTVTIVP